MASIYGDRLETQDRIFRLLVKQRCVKSDSELQYIPRVWFHCEALFYRNRQNLVAYVYNVLFLLFVTIIT